MNQSTLEQMATLPSMEKAQLLGLWAEVFHHPPPARIRRKLMVSVLAYRLQEREYGGLSNSARQKLAAVAKRLRSHKQSRSSIASTLKTGTRLVRSWGGEVHEVSVSGSGYEYRGRQFKSLSVIAREITGTRWSGPLFFGTKKKAA